MHCRNCSKEIDDKAVVCIHCGVPPKVERKFCPNCGVSTVANQAVCTSCGVALRGGARKKSKPAYTLLALFLGPVGGHKFYMGMWGWGVVYIVLCLTLFAIWLPALLGVVECVRAILMTDAEFDRKVAEAESDGLGPFGNFW